jgi:hypothetical protein
MKFDRVVEFVGKVRKRGSRGGCRKCKERRGRLVLRGRPTLSALYRGGASVEEIKDAIRKRGWYCRGCVNEMGGFAAAVVIRGDFPLGDEGTRLYQHHQFRTCRPPEGWEYDPTTVDGEPGWRKVNQESS